MDFHWQKQIELMKKSLFFLLFLISMASCQKDDLISLRIKVKDNAGKALPNASVILNGTELGRTDGRGMFVKYLVIKKGEHRLEIAKNKGKVLYTPYKQNIMYYRDEDKKINLELTLSPASEIAQSKSIKQDAFPILIPQKEPNPAQAEKAIAEKTIPTQKQENPKIESPKVEVSIEAKTPTNIASLPALPKATPPSKTLNAQTPIPKLKTKPSITKTTPAPKARLAKAEKLIANGKVSSALMLLKETPKNHPEYIRSLQKTSEVYLNLLNDPANALIAYEKLTKLPELQSYDKTKLLDIYVKKAIAAFNVGELKVQGKKAGALKMYQTSYGLLVKTTKLLTKDQEAEQVNTINYYRALSLHRVWQLHPGSKLGNRVIKEWLTFQKSVRKNPGSKGISSLENSEVYLHQARSKNPNQIKELF